MTIGNEELMQECFPKHLRTGTARMKQDREREEDKRCVSMERSKAGTKKMKSQRPNIAQAYRPPGSLRPETVDEFLN